MLGAFFLGGGCLYRNLTCNPMRKRNGMQGTETYKFKMKEKGVHLWTKTKSTPLYIYIFFLKKKG